MSACVCVHLYHACVCMHLYECVWLNAGICMPVYVCMTHACVIGTGPLIRFLSLATDSCFASCQLYVLHACRGRLHTIMVTGDHHLTAMAVAQVTGMMNIKRPHILIAQPDAIFLPNVSSLDSSIGPAYTLGQRRTQSSTPVDLKAHAALVSQPQPSSSSRSKSLSQVELSALKGVSGVSFSSKPLVTKAALQQIIPPQAAHKTINQLPNSHGDAQPQQPPHTDGVPQSLFRARSTEPFTHSQLSAQTSVDDLAHLQQPASAEPDLGHDELTFFIADEAKLVMLSRREAFAMIATGHQCVITGSVFDYLLHEADPTLLETVLHNVAVCARMKAQQKAQLVNLLSEQGMTVSSTRKFKVQQALPTLSAVIHPAKEWVSGCTCHEVALLCWVKTCQQYWEACRQPNCVACEH